MNDFENSWEVHFVFVVRLCFGKTSLASVEMGEARAGPPVCNSEVGVGSASLLTLKLQRELVLSVCGQRCSGRGVGGIPLPRPWFSLADSVCVAL